jgi:4-amino-4-deoxy-L-arabinose transferase-like glycosyltransferase
LPKDSFEQVWLSNQCSEKEARRTRLLGLASLSLLIIFHVLNNGLWRATNVVVFGSDRIFHLVTSLAYYDILRQGVNLHSLFAALTWSNYYPPLVHLTAAGFYGLFGVSMDVAAMSTSLFLALLLVAVYFLGKRLAGPWIGFLSAFVFSMFPIVFSMSRYLYVDLALTAMVAANLCLLLYSDRFQRKGISLLYGLSLGLGMLTKWTFAAFAAAPLVLMLASPGLIRATVRVLYHGTRDWRRWLVAGSIGLGITAVWFLPNVEATAALPLGYALAPISWLMWGVTCYLMMAPTRVAQIRRADPGANLLAALGLGASVASSWYLTKINFLGTFWLNAYGKPTGRTWGFGQYLGFLYQEQLSALFVVVLVVALGSLIWVRWRRSRSWRQMLALGLEGWALVLWVVASYVIFSSRVSIVHSRYLMPLLPPLAIAIAWGLSLLRPGWLRGVLIGGVSLLALGQFAALSFDALGPLQAQVPVLAQGLSIQLPASGRTDPGYGVVPDIVQYVDDHRDTDSPQLGILVNSPQVNSQQFIYTAYAEHPRVRIAELATIGRAQPSYPRLFESDFILLIDPVPDYVRRPDTVETIRRLLTEPDDTFHRVFELAKTYPLPDGNQLNLYKRRFGLAPQSGVEQGGELMAFLKQVSRPGDAVLAMPPEQVYALGRYGDGSLPIYPLPSEPGPQSGADMDLVTQLGKQYQRLWLVLDGSLPDGAAAQMTQWLAGRFYRADDRWYGPLQLLLYAPGTGEGEPGDFQTGEVMWQNGIALQAYRILDSSLPLGGILRLDLQWQANEPIPERYKVFIHLLDGQGQVLSQRDSEPVDGTQPTTAWQPGKMVADKYGLWLPADLSPGEYMVVLGFYDAASGERVLACCPSSDAVSLMRVRVEDNNAYPIALVAR